MLDLEACGSPAADTVLVSVMAANNEIGVLQPIAEIAALCRPQGIALHVDGAQLVGHQRFEPLALGIDLLSLSGHKSRPQGRWRSAGGTGVELKPQLHGGGQEGAAQRQCSTAVGRGTGGSPERALADAPRAPSGLLPCAIASGRGCSPWGE